MHTNHSVAVIARAVPKRRATGRWALAEHLRRMRENAALFVSLAQKAGIDIGFGVGESAGGPMIPCIVGSSIKTLQLSDALTRRGINAVPNAFPAAPEQQARISFFVTSCHS